MTPRTTALILIGYQNDYYAPEGALHGYLEDSEQVARSLERTIELVERLAPTDVSIIETPIVFTENYSELRDPVGILEAIRSVGAFRAGKPGSETVKAFAPFKDRIVSIPGKRGMNAFIGTALETALQSEQIEDVILAGSVASICIDSTGRSAAERGYRVHFARDCITGRTPLELNLYCDSVFSLYAEVTTSAALIGRLAG